LVSLSFNDFYFLLNPILFLSFLWFLFFKLNNNVSKITTEVSTNINILKINSNSLLVNFYFFLMLLLFTSIYTIQGKNSAIWFNHFNINNHTLNLFYLFTFLGFCLYFLIKQTTKKVNLFKSIDYLFSINNLLVILPYLFFVQNVFIFLFLLELVSVLLFYKLVSSKIWFKNSTNTKQIQNNIPQNYINMVFFQYWVTFFSTIFIIYFYINIFYIYGTSDWFVLQFLNCLNIENTSISINLIRVLLIIFLVSIFFKLGITPFHLFKIEVYKGIPFMSIFFYTTYYFSIFFIFILYVLSDFLAGFIIQYYLMLVFMLCFGCIYVIVLLFDVSFLKAFFTYSTIINTIGFLMAFIAAL